MLTDTREIQNREVMSAMDQVVDIADWHVSNDPRITLVTYSLGSCIGVVIWDQIVKVGGMLHFMLPDSSISADKATVNPAMFADTGLPRLFQEQKRFFLCA